MAVKSHWFRAVVGAALMGGALLLWLSVGAPTYAGTAQVNHEGTVVVADRTVEWGSQGDCIQDMSPADFGTQLPNTTVQSAMFKGCVTSNSDGWFVMIDSTDFVGLVPSHVIPRGHEAIVVDGLDGTLSSGFNWCPGAGGCALGTGTFVQDGLAGTGGFTYHYNLNVPFDAVGDTYTNNVIFTASN
jgi:hypothetical protein